MPPKTRRREPPDDPPDGGDSDGEEEGDGEQVTLVRTLHASLKMPRDARRKFVSAVEKISEAVSRNLRRASLIAAFHFARLLNEGVEFDAVAEAKKWKKDTFWRQMLLRWLS